MPLYLQKRNGWTLVALLLCSFYASAFEHGLMEVPSALQEARDQMLRDPSHCVLDLEQFLLRSPEYADKIETPRSAEASQLRINALQLMSVCQLMVGHSDEALLTLDRIKRGEYPRQSLRLRSELIRAWITGEESDPEKMNSAIEQLLNLLGELKSDASLDADGLRYQLSRLLGTFYLQRGKYQDARKLLELAVRQASLMHDDLLEGWALLYLGDYYLRIGKPAVALSRYIEGKKRGGKRLLQARYLSAEALMKMAMIYDRQQELKQAIASAEEAIGLYQSMGNERKQADALLLLSQFYYQQEKFNLSLVQAINALELVKSFATGRELAWIRLRVGEAYIRLGRYPQAQTQLEKARKGFSDIQDNGGIQKTLLLLGEIYLHRNEEAMAMEYLHKASELAKQEGQADGSESVYSLLAEGYQRKGYFQKALEYYRLYVEALKQNVKLDQQLKRDAFKLQYQLVEQKNKIGQLEHAAQLQENRSVQMRVITIALCMLTLFVLIFVVMLRKRAALFEQKSKTLSEQLLNHPVSGLPSANRYPGFVEGLLDDHLKGLSDEGATFSMAVVKLGGISNLYEQRGRQQGNKILALLGRFIRNHFNKIEFYHLRDDLLLVISPAQQAEQGRNLGELLIRELSRFFLQVRLPDAVSVGVCAYPFLPHAPNGLPAEKVIEVAYIALYGACQLQESRESSQWLELKALSCMHPAFIGGEVRTQCRQAIQKGLIKVSYAGEKEVLHW